MQHAIQMFNQAPGGIKLAFIIGILLILLSQYKYIWWLINLPADILGSLLPWIPWRPIGWIVMILFGATVWGINILAIINAVAHGFLGRFIDGRF